MMIDAIIARARMIWESVPINWPRVAMPSNNEQELQDLGDLEAGNQNDIQGIVTDEPSNASPGAATLPNSEDDPDEFAEVPTGEFSEPTVTNLPYNKLKLGVMLLGLNLWITYHLHNSYIAMSATNCHLLRTASCVLSAMSAALAVHTMQMRLPSGRWTCYVWLSFEAMLLANQVVVTISTFK